MTHHHFYDTFFSMLPLFFCSAGQVHITTFTYQICSCFTADMSQVLSSSTYHKAFAFTWNLDQISWPEIRAVKERAREIIWRPHPEISKFVNSRAPIINLVLKAF